MSSSQVKLVVRAALPATEIFIIDSRFRRLKSGVGEVETQVSPGYYKIRFRAGNAQQDQLIEVGPDQEQVEILGESIAFESAVPLSDTSTTREAQAAAAERASHDLHAEHGRGSRLLVFVRDLERGIGTRPWEGVSVYTLSGELIVTLEDGEVSEADAFGALSLELDPGTYCLRVNTGALGNYEMFVVTCEGWQTQVFSVVESFAAGDERVRRAALRSISVLMARIGQGFESDADAMKLADLARLGLGAGRQVVRGEDLDALLTGKLENPMLGIYGAYLLLMAHRPDHRLIDRVASKLLGLLGPHPDVQALALRPGAPTPPTELAFPSPPMLRRSWDLVVQASRRRVSMVPPGSTSDRVAEGLLPSSPWLLHRVPESVAKSSAPADVSFAEGRRLIEALAELQQTAQVASKVEAASRRPGELSVLEHSLLKATVPFGGTGEERLVAKGIESRVSVTQVLNELDAPSVSIARSARSLFDKLDLAVPDREK